MYTPGDIKVIDGEGMPMNRNAFIKGNLYVEFKLEFPESGTLSDGDRNILRSVLPASKSQTMMDIDVKDDDVEVCTLKDVDMDAERAKREASAAETREAYEEDEEHEHPGVGCRSQ